MPDDPEIELVMAVMCERSLEETNGMLSIIRVIGESTISVTGPDAPATMPQVPVRIGEFVMMFRSPGLEGQKEAELWCLFPSGKRSKAFTLPVTFGGDRQGMNIRADIVLAAPETGLLWFEVVLDGQVLGRSPFRLKYQRVPEPIPEEGSPSESPPPPPSGVVP